MSLPGSFDKAIQKSREEQGRQRKRWHLSLLYLADQQHLEFHNRLGRFVVDPLRARRRVTVNRIKPLVRTAWSSLATQFPSCVVMPGSPSYEDIVKAMSSEHMLRWDYASDRMRHKWRKAFGWTLTTGTVGHHIMYKRDVGQHEGRVTDVIVRPDCLYKEEGARDEYESSWLAAKEYYTREELIRLYPKRKKQINRITPTERFGDLETKQMPADRIEVYYVYTWNGDWGVWAGDDWLWKGETPEKTMPIIVQRHFEVPGSFWGMGLVQSVIGLQNQYNRVRAQELLNIELMANPLWLIPRTARVGKIASKAGGKVYYNIAGGKPEMTHPSPLPNHVSDNRLFLNSEMHDVAGIHRSQMGGRDVGITAAKAMRELKEGDMGQLQLSMLLAEDAAERVAEAKLIYYRHFYDDERFVSALDGMGSIISRQLDSTRLVDTPEVHIEAGTMFPARAQHRDMKIREQLEMGVMDPQEARKELSFRTGNKHVLKKMQAYDKALSALDMVVRGGQAIKVFPHEDIEAYRDVFDEFVNSDKFYMVHPVQQKYLRDALASLATYGQNPEAYWQMVGGTVVPRTDAQQQAPQSIGWSNSPATRDQMQQRQQESQMVKSAAETRQGTMAH